MALVCGPEGMMCDVSELCFKYGFKFHAETFLL
jgi:hypothetical protein